MKLLFVDKAIALHVLCIAAAGSGIAGCAAVDDDPADAVIDKASAPETNLAAFPKLARPPRADEIAKTSDRLSVDVEVVTITGDVTSIDTYDPAPGVTPEALADSLRRAGHDNVQVITSDAARNVGPYDCSYGQAHSGRCPVIYWLNNGESNPIVLFNDHSGVTWPVSTATYKWNQVLGIDSAYRYNTCSGSFPGAHCVDVYSGSYGINGWLGHTHRTYSGAQVIIAAYTELNDSYDPIAYGFTRNHLATHEMGHVLGLGHNDWSGDVMYEFGNTREDIGGENQTLLQAIYSVDR